MATYYVYLRGKTKWSNRLTGAGDLEYQCWNTSLYPDQESKDIFLKLRETTATGVEGIMNTLKVDEDGEFFSLKRPFKLRIKGTEIPLAPPIILDKDNQPLMGVTIGNGSDVTCKVMVYQHKKMGGKKGQALRLEAVRVDNLVEFNVETDYRKEEQRQVKGLIDQPGQHF